VANIGELATSPGDVMRRLRDLERQLRELRSARSLEASTIGRGGLRIKGGNLEVTDAGLIIIRDGGDFNIEDGGRLRWFDPTGNLRMEMRSAESAAGNHLVNLASFGPAGATAYIGGIEDTTDGTHRQGVLVQTPDGQDVLWVMSGDYSGKLQLTPSADDELDLRDASGTFRATLGPVTWGGQSDGYGIYVQRADGSPVFYASQSKLEWSDNGTRALAVELASNNTRIYGGNGGDGSLYGMVRIYRRNGSNPATEIQARDGADSVLIPMVASTFNTSSSAALKDVLGDAPSALEKVRATPIRRWRYKQPPRARTPDGAVGAADEPSPEHIGPVAEEAPAELRSGDPGDEQVSLNDALWMLWKANQELADKVDELRAQVDELSGR